MSKKFHIELGEPSVIAQGENTGWGNYQFPHICYTKSGSIRATWAMRPDTVDGFAGKGYGEAISDDGGKSWRAPTAEDIVIPPMMLKNGKAFWGFKKEYAFETNAFDGHTPICSRNGTGVYFADDVKGIDKTIYAKECDVETGEISEYPINMDWRYMAVLRYPNNRALTMGYMMASCGDIADVLFLDDGMYFCTYAVGFDITAKTKEEAVTKYSSYSSVFVFRSTDDTRNWECISQISISDDIFNDALGFEGFDEPMMEQMPDGSVVMLIRSGSPQSPLDPNRYPCYITRSTDNCRTWSKPIPFGKVGVLPQIQALPCGVTLAVFGRPELFIRASADPSGIVWDEPIEINLTPSIGDRSCYYTKMLPLDDNSVLLIYTDFNYPDVNDGTPKKTVLVRTLKVIFDN